MNQISGVHQVEYQLEDGLVLVGIGKYTGAYMEDGSNEIVSGILMAEIRNTSERDLQYAKLQVQYQNTNAQFVISNLPAGETMIVSRKTETVSRKKNQSRFDCLVIPGFRTGWIL